MLSGLKGLVEWRESWVESQLDFTPTSAPGRFLLPAWFPCLQTERAERDTFLPFFLKQIFI